MVSEKRDSHPGGSAAPSLAAGAGGGGGCGEGGGSAGAPGGASGAGAGGGSAGALNCAAGAGAAALLGAAGAPPPSIAHAFAADHAVIFSAPSFMK